MVNGVREVIKEGRGAWVDSNVEYKGWEEGATGSTVSTPQRGPGGRKATRAAATPRPPSQKSICAPTWIVRGRRAEIGWLNSADWMLPW